MSEKLHTVGVDMGCGLKSSGIDDYSNFADVAIGLDNSLTTLSANLHVRDGSLLPVCADVRHLPFADDSVDIIYASHVLEHIPAEDYTIVLEEINGTLRTGGELTIAVPHRRYEAVMGRILPGYNSDRMHQQVFSSSELKGVIENEGFEIKQSGNRKWVMAIGLVTQAIASRFSTAVECNDQLGFASTKESSKVQKIKQIGRKLIQRLDSLLIVSDVLNRVFPFEIYVEVTKQ